MLEAFLVTMLINSQPGLDLQRAALAASSPQTVESLTPAFDSLAPPDRIEPKPGRSDPVPELVEVKAGGAEKLITLEDGEWDFSSEAVKRTAPKYPQWGWLKQHTRRLAQQDQLWNPTGKQPLFQDWSPF